jgi:hypothetical protein
MEKDKGILQNWLICGTRKKGYKALVFAKLNELIKDNKPNSIIEGCCPNSADAYAEEWANENGIEIQHHPSTTGNYLRRNIEMVSKCSLVICFWDGFSYGSCHTVAQAVMKGKPVVIIDINNQNGKN